ncbi:MAG TPA: Rieske 2Fe-2S domain-containing protein [Ramlibacter sp.]|uniref:aromatic ring-hydroxylating oxygenase subunit alpha n=1 Tax=Ramlibacter sp. TaxID=1917967 RepID=UPI002BAE4B6B|nr:Rieske 2Fe-2S domain-containing protein [Ramlibacter sp.]HVZ46489.1 Rieske 2Fe-2S domain-containing protein [Ramlibacter sp.]
MDLTPGSIVTPPKERRATGYGALIEHDRVHASLYCDPVVFDDEMQRIFYGGWVFVGHESEIPNPGDYVCRFIGLEEVVMVRNQAGVVRVLSNRCTHRGNRICPTEKGNARVLTCQYHAWSFSLDGELLAVPRPNGFCKPKEEFHLQGPALVDSYRGFVFASFDAGAGSLPAHLGHAAAMIDRAADQSPTGRISLCAGWARHAIRGNWKSLLENATDGYHTPVVHASFLQTFRTQYDVTAAPERERVAESRDLGNGHGEVNFVPRYKKILEWLGSSAEKLPGYVEAMELAYGKERAHRLMLEGAPHVTIFPNLFIGEANIVIFQPISADESVQWHTAMLFEGADASMNARALRQSEGALGPSSFLLADDAVIFERLQSAGRGRAGWLDLSRGLNREEEAQGIRTGYATDETSTRAFWRQYQKVMKA